MRSPALAVLAVGVVAVLVQVGRDRMALGETLGAVDLPVIAGLFGVAIALGTLAALWSGPTRLLQHANAAETAAIAAVASVVVNNLPAAVMLSAHAPRHPRALLIGLDVGPNLAVTGSLSALLWFKAVKSVGVQPSLARVSRIGFVLVPCTIAAALGALAVVGPGRV